VHAMLLTKDGGEVEEIGRSSRLVPGAIWSMDMREGSIWSIMRVSTQKLLSLCPKSIDQVCLDERWQSTGIDRNGVCIPTSNAILTDISRSNRLQHKPYLG